jgi:hypothetical protein
MERSVTEVEPTCQRMEKTSLEKRKRIGNELNVRIGKELLNDSKQGYLKFLHDFKKKGKNAD